MSECKNVYRQTPGDFSQPPSLPERLPWRARPQSGQAERERAELPDRAGAKPAEAAWLELVQRQVDSLQFGVVQIIVHDSRVTQIERTERVRLERPEPHVI